MTRSCKYCLAVLGVVAGALLLGTKPLFRQEIDDNPALGLITRQYRWGRPAYLLADVDRDGNTDMRVRVDGTFANVPPREFWEGPCGEGRYRFHVRLFEGEITQLDIDSHCRGTYDVRLVGAEARRYYETIRNNRLGTNDVLHLFPRKPSGVQ